MYVPEGGKLSTWYYVCVYVCKAFRMWGYVGSDGGKLSTRYYVWFIPLQHIPHVGLCRFLTAVNCQPGIMLVLSVYNTSRTFVV